MVGAVGTAVLFEVLLAVELDALATKPFEDGWDFVEDGTAILETLIKMLP